MIPPEASVEGFRRDGAVLLPALLDAEGVERLRAVAARHGETRGAEGAPAAGFWSESDLWRRDPDVRRLLVRGPAARAVATLLGTRRLWLYEDTLLVKEPGTARPTPWHQDLPHYPLSGQQVATSWISLDHVVAESGAVRYVRGSHRADVLYAPVEFTSGKIHHGPGLVPPPDLDYAPSPGLVVFETRPGDCVVHHALTLHGAPGNATERPRRALAASFFGEDVRFTRRDFPWRHPRAEDLVGGSLSIRDAYPLAWDDDDG
ncbi:MAG TPA: phytanoyl-CoA dioxygenase family protein [Candidatus Dormibacteraeota bacterium]|nr:phytanoyl-CoA dioxygenase family protein [Candidatus Dormibacteraeota bacterium]